MKNRRPLRVALAAVALTLPLATAVPGPTSAAPPAPAAAKAASAVRMMTFNIQYGNGGKGGDGEDLARVASVIKYYDPRVVLLNEVDLNKPGCKDKLCNQAGYLARKLGMRYRYFAIEDKAGKHWRGNAILIDQRYRFVGKQGKTHLRPGTPASCYRRGVLGATIDVGGKRIVVGSTHLDYADRGTRCPGASKDTTVDVAARQAKFVRDKVIGRPSCATFLAGDMNRTPGSLTHRALSKYMLDVWTRKHQGNAATNGFESGGTPKRIDFIFYAKAVPYSADVPGAKTPWDDDDDFPSDHKPVVASFKVSAAQSC